MQSRRQLPTVNSMKTMRLDKLEKTASSKHWQKFWQKLWQKHSTAGEYMRRPHLWHVGDQTSKEGFDNSIYFVVVFNFCAELWKMIAWQIAWRRDLAQKNRLDPNVLECSTICAKRLPLRRERLFKTARTDTRQRFYESLAPQSHTCSEPTCKARVARHGALCGNCNATTKHGALFGITEENKVGQNGEVSCLSPQ